MTQQRWWPLACLALLAAGRVAPGADPPAGDRDALALAAKIDKHLQVGWDAAKVKPAPLADDAEFLRRASLHLVGRIPSVSESRAFMRDTAPDKRVRVVERMQIGRASCRERVEIWVVAVSVRQI